MLDILSITSPIYFIIGLGFGLTKVGLFSKLDMRVFGKFVLNLALPALVFKALSQRQFSEVFNSSYLLAYMVGTLLVLGVGYSWTRYATRQSPLTSTFYAMGMGCSNSGFVGYPILLLTLAPVAGVVLALNMLVENLVILPLLLVLAERGKGSGHAGKALAQSLVKVAKTPLIVGLLAGLAISISGWKLPAPVTQTVTLFSNASGALSLFVIGGALVGLPLAGMGQRVWPIVLGKLVLHPLMVLLCILALPYLGLAALDPSLRTGALLLAAMPMMGIYPTLAQAYGQEDFAAAATLAATVLSFFSISALLWVLQH
ncbi:AEC family transporter [Rhodoferax sp. GW822-FHT02A01]|uniref:AEC family transporter n=1 Tax=Rhodoferax sp. GW822-FHT02A01 TaxID=3141537 RepID=UPI00315DF0AF